MALSNQLIVKQTLSRANKAAKKGDFALSIQLYNEVLDHQPKHPIAKKALQKLEKQLSHSQPIQNQLSNPPQDQLNDLINLYQLGQLIKAEQACKKTLKTYPRSLVVLNILGATLKGQGKLREAVQVFDKAIGFQPDYADAYNNRGVILTDLGQFQDAVESLDKAIQLKPNSAEQYNNRGNALKELNQLKKSIENYGKAIQLMPDYAVAYYNRGNALRDLEQLEDAIENYNKAIQLKTDYADAYNNRGIALTFIGRLEEAAESFAKAIQLLPNFAMAHNNLGNVLQDLGQFEKAIVHYDRTILLTPDYPLAHYNRGNALKDLGRLSEAVECYDKAIQLNPNYAEAFNNCGNTLKDLGLIEEAFASFNKLIQLKPYNAEAHRSLSTIKKYNTDDAHIGIMEAMFSDSQITEADRIQLCFALAKVYEDLGDYDKSFNYLEEGNRLRKKELNYHIDKDNSLFAQIKKTFSAVTHVLGDTSDINESISPLFIVGMPRSGTTLAEQIIASHSEVYGAGELSTLDNIIRPILATIFDPCDVQAKNKLSSNNIITVHDGYLESLAALNVQEKIISDKMPLNFRWIGFILSAFPHAKVINLNRDPRATCWSIYKHYFSSNGNGYAHDLIDLVEFYKLYTDLMSFWRERFPNSIYDLCYEDLTENQEEETRKLLDFCGLMWDEQCLNFHKTKRAVKTLSALQVRKKMYKGSSDAWRSYEKHLQPLINGLQS